MPRAKRKKNGKPPSNSTPVESSKNQVPKLLEPKNKKLKKSVEKTPKSINEEGTSQSQVTGKSQVTGDGKKKTSDGVGKEGDVNASHSLKMKNKNKNKDEIHVKQPETKVGRLPNSEKDLAGLIFLCNTETKPDCFRYQVMAVSAAKKEVVLGIKPGLKLFMFDFGLRLLYGVYEASSPGAMNIEPSAFGGKFPAQVRFRVCEDCLPLPESVFKKAIKENYDEKTNKFQFELTSQQVNTLKTLFRPTHHPQKDLPALPQPLSSSDSLYVTEEEYRRFGLRPNLHNSRPDVVSYPLIPDTSRNPQQWPQIFMAPAPIYRDAPSTNVQIYGAPISTYREMPREQIVGGPTLKYGNSSSLRDEAVRSDPVFLSEEEYRLYGLRGRPEQISEQPVARSKEDEHRQHGLRGRPEQTSEQPAARSKEDEHRLHGLRGRPEQTSEQPVARSNEDEHRLYGLRGRPEQNSLQPVARSKEVEYRLYALGGQTEAPTEKPIGRSREDEDRLYALRGQNDPSFEKPVARSSEDEYRLYGFRGQTEPSSKNSIVHSSEDKYRLFGLKGQTEISSEKHVGRYSEDEYRLYGLRDRTEPSSQKHIERSREDEDRLYGLRGQNDPFFEKPVARSSQDEFRLYGLRDQNDPSFDKPVARSSEDEYRLYGLRGQTEPSSKNPIVRSSEDEYRLFGLKGQTETFSEKHVGRSSEDEYRLYGLRGRTEQSSEKLVVHAREMDYPENRYLPSNNHETAADPYLRLPSGGATPYEVYRQRTVTTLPPTDSSLGNHSTDYAMPRTATNEGRYSSYGSHELSDYNQRDRRVVDSGRPADGVSAPVSSRYAFEGASYSYR